MGPPCAMQETRSLRPGFPHMNKSRCGPFHNPRRLARLGPEQQPQSDQCRSSEVCVSTTERYPMGVGSPRRARIPDKTLRADRWWLQPLITFLVFTAFVVYATWRAFMGSDYYSSPYLS